MPYARLKSLLVALLFLAPAGCEVDYFAHLIAGQLAAVAEALPVEEALNDPRLSETDKAKLLLTQEVRQFGIDRIGLTAGDSFTVVEFNGDTPAAYVLSASAKDSFTPYVWWFPGLGAWQAKGFFDQSMAQREAERLAAEGWDVYLGVAEGYSTLGFFADPVRQSNLRSLDEIDLADLILHELLHQTVIKASDIDFSESLGTWVGRTAAEMWFEERFGAGSDAAIAARERFEDAAQIDAWVVETYQRMEAYYADSAAAGMTREEIIAGREAEFDIARQRYETFYRPQLHDLDRWGPIGDATLDNAMLMGAVRYQGTLNDYQAVFDAVGRNFPDALEVFRQAADAEDSREFLQTWLVEHP